MAWENFVRHLAIRSRRKAVATALVYGLSLAVRFTSAAGEETEISTQASQGTNPLTSIVTANGTEAVYNKWLADSAQPMPVTAAARRLLGAAALDAKASLATPSIPSCSSHP